MKYDSGVFGKDGIVDVYPTVLSQARVKIVVSGQRGDQLMVIRPAYTQEKNAVVFHVPVYRRVHLVYSGRIFGPV